MRAEDLIATNNSMKKSIVFYDEDTGEHLIAFDGHSAEIEAIQYGSYHSVKCWEFDSVNEILRIWI